MTTPTIKLNINQFKSRSPEWETKEAISDILNISMKPVGFRIQLEEMLNILMSISWLKVGNKGGIFVTNNNNELILKAEHNLSSEIKSMCAKVKMGQCLCGIAASTKKIVYKTCVDDDHSNCFEGMADHGHYNIPLLNSENDILGVIVFYLEHHHTQHPEEIELMRMIGQTLSNVISNRNLQYKSEVSQILRQQAQVDIIHKLVTASEYRDNETGEHIQRMSKYAGVIAKKIGLSEEDVDRLVLAAPLHDIGKVGISDSILLKPGRLDTNEIKIMQTHTTIGAEILSGEYPLIKAGREIALSHHEQWDGTGYPHKLAGEDIPVFARICALADVFDALTTKRPYKEPWPLEKALEYIVSASGGHFDPALVTAFMESQDEILQIKSLYSENELKTSPLLIQKDTKSSKVKWDTEYSIGIDLIDEQHQYFYNLINRVDEAIEKQDVVSTVNHLIELKKYAQIHFVDEETIMEDCAYPKLKEHKEFHVSFIKKIESFLNDIEVSPLAVTAELTNFLTNWLQFHTQKSDYDFALFLREKNNPQPTTIQ